MNFTREPIVETIITPKEGCKLAVRNSKGVGQEEYFVDALEVVSFGNAFFFRSLERPKCFLVPVSDYEILEVRETRMVLKTPSIERVKIGGGRDTSVKPPKEIFHREEPEVTSEEEPAKLDVRNEKKRDRRRNRRRRGRDDIKEPVPVDEEETAMPFMERETEEYPLLIPTEEVSHQTVTPPPPPPPPPLIPTPPPVFTSLLAPPTKLISETISHYRGNPQYTKAFFTPSEEGAGDIAQETTTQLEEAHQDEALNPEDFPQGDDQSFTPLETEDDQFGNR